MAITSTWIKRTEDGFDVPETQNVIFLYASGAIEIKPWGEGRKTNYFAVTRIPKVITITMFEEEHSSTLPTKR